MHLTKTYDQIRLQRNHFRIVMLQHLCKIHKVQIHVAGANEFLQHINYRLLTAWSCDALQNGLACFFAIGLQGSPRRDKLPFERDSNSRVQEESQLECLQSSHILKHSGLSAHMYKLNMNEELSHHHLCRLPGRDDNTIEIAACTGVKSTYLVMIFIVAVYEDLFKGDCCSRNFQISICIFFRWSK